MGLEGSVNLHLYRHAGRVNDVKIQSTRPLQAVRIFEGKSPEEMLKTLPLLFNICGVAQANAAINACEQVLVTTHDSNTHKAREMLVWTETAREHLWRIMMEWSEKLGEEKDKIQLVKLHQSIDKLKKALFKNGDAFSLSSVINMNKKEVFSEITSLNEIIQTQVFAMHAEKWLNISTIDELHNWITSDKTLASRMLKQVGELYSDHIPGVDSHFLPQLNENKLQQLLAMKDADDFAAKPEWDGHPCETGSLSRQSNHPLVMQMIKQRGIDVLTRMVARLVELASIPAKLEKLSEEIAGSNYKNETNAKKQVTGMGLSQVEAARGRLIHRVELDKGIIRRYQIIAPTEWNFHPQGIAAQLLKSLSADDEQLLRQQADIMINTIDPCVQYELVVH